MSRYRRVYVQGGKYFFTLVTRERKKILTKPESVKRLRTAFTVVKKTHPFQLEDIVILPDHLHFIMQLPQGDNDFSTRIRLIKSYFSRGIKKHNADVIWQNRFWEHMVRHDRDHRNCKNYLYYNPVKHGYVQRVRDWRYSSFIKAVSKKQYPINWASVHGDDFVPELGYE